MSNLMNTLKFKNLEFVGGKGPYLVDSAGNCYLDFFTDVGTASLGYGCREHRVAAHALIDNVIHAPNLFQYDSRNSASKRLCEATGMDKVFWCNSGTESVEAAIKLARKYQYDKMNRLGDRNFEIWSQWNGFHGRTYGSLAAGDGPEYHYEGFGQLPSDFRHFKDIYEISPHAAAVILSPIFGNNDVRVPDYGWLKDLRQYTESNNILLIFDEVQTGMGRCGGFTYGQLCGIKPDILTLAKGVGMGFPVGAMLASEKVANAFTPGSHFSTFGGNPASCLYVSVMLDWLKTEGNLKSIREKGEIIKGTLEINLDVDVRGEGMLLAFDSQVECLDLADRCLQRGLIVGAFRKGPGPVKITPPLNIELEDLNEGLIILCEVYKEMTFGSQFQPKAEFNWSDDD